jgi:ankyrin repeat protein
MWPDALTQQDNRARTPFHYSCLNLSKAMIQILLQYPNIHRMEDTYTTTMTSYSSFSLPLINVNLVDRDGNIPLHLAIMGFRHGECFTIHRILA